MSSQWEVGVMLYLDGEVVLGTKVPMDEMAAKATQEGLRADLIDLAFLVEGGDDD